MNDTNGRRVDRLVAAVALCLLAASVPAVAVAADEGASAAVQATDGSTGAPVEPPAEAFVHDRGSHVIGDVEQATAPEGMPVGSALGQLVGVLIVLLVLAGIGVAAWGVRPDELRGFDRASNALSRIPAGRVGATENAASEGSLLTDEERIIELLEENDGRLKQQHVVETTDWSKAKVSRLLSSMEDDDAIIRIQLGREKLIFLSGQEPRGARSVHHEEG